ncbi:MAG: four helix bundle protein [Flavobacteriales bacterium]
MLKDLKKQEKKDKIKFLNIAQGSLEECRYYLILSSDLGYCKTKKLKCLLVEVSKLLKTYSDEIKRSK